MKRVVDHDPSERFPTIFSNHDDISFFAESKGGAVRR